MSTPTAEVARLLADAAELKAGGASWEQVAARVGRRPATCRRWPVLYPDEWQRLLRSAERRLLAEAGAEGVHILRELLRSEDDKVRRDAARTLAALWDQCRRREKAADADARDPEKRYMEGMTDAQVHTFTDDVRPIAEPG